MLLKGLKTSTKKKIEKKNLGHSPLNFRPLQGILLEV